MNLTTWTKTILCVFHVTLTVRVVLGQARTNVSIAVILSISGIISVTIFHVGMGSMCIPNKDVLIVSNCLSIPSHALFSRPLSVRDSIR